MLYICTVTYMQPSEARIQQECVVWFKNHYKEVRDLLYHIDNGAHKSPAKAAVAKGMGITEGIPDLHLALPHMQYNGAYFEMKRVGTYSTPKQKEIQAKLRAVGYYVAECRSLEEFKTLVTDYLAGVL
jgi:hypothetical protein